MEPSVYRGESISAEEKGAFYDALAEQMDALLEEGLDPVANLANAASLIYLQVEGLNWAGFYRLRGDELSLGPFQGKPACTRIAMGKGVCGTAAANRRTEIVADVHAFPGHIACDPDSRSELVVPLFSGDELAGVLDLDSPRLERFDEEDGRGMERVLSVVSRYL